MNNGRIREREFFNISPETPYGIFKDIASLHYDTKKLKLYAPILEQSQEQEIAERKTKRSNNSFKMLNIAVEEDIAFLYDDTVAARIFSDKNQVEYECESYSVTKLAFKLLVNINNYKG